MDMKRKIAAKLRSLAGESLAETLIALLISSLALLMLAGAVTSATRVVNRSKEKMTEYYKQDAAVAGHKTQAGTISMTVTDVTADTMDHLTGITYSGMPYYVNDAFENRDVVAYVLPAKP